MAKRRKQHNRKQEGGGANGLAPNFDKDASVMDDSVTTQPQAEEEAPIIETPDSDEEKKTEAPEPTRPSWRDRVAASEAEAEKQFRVKPGSWLDKKTRRKVKTRRQWEREDQQFRRYLSLGLIEPVE